MNENIKVYERLNKLLLNDKVGAYDGFVGVLKNDLDIILSQYMEIKNLEVKLDVGNQSQYEVMIKVEAKNIIVPNTIT